MPSIQILSDATYTPMDISCSLKLPPFNSRIEIIYIVLHSMISYFLSLWMEYLVLFVVVVFEYLVNST